MKRQYVPITLDAFLNESKTITLKRKYGERQPVVVGSNAPLRNQVLAYVAEGARVSKTDLKKFIAGLNEGSRNPIAAANMWLMRNSKFFVTESKGGVTYYKLSSIGKRLSSGLTTSTSLSESEEKNIRKKLNEFGPRTKREEDDAAYDFVDRTKGKPRPGIYDAMEEAEECEDDEKKEIDEAAKARIKRIIENIKAKRKQKLNEEEEEKVEDEEEKVEGDEEGEEKEAGTEDELTFDDLDLGDDAEKEEGEKEAGEEDDEEKEGEGDGDVEGVEKVEITEFVITVDNVEEAIQELADLDVTAEKVLDEENEEIEDQIKVSVDFWEPLKTWLEEKGVDIEEMFGGEIEVEGEGEEDEDIEGGEDEGDVEDIDVDLEDDNLDDDKLDGEMDSEDFDLDLGGLEDEGELDLSDDDEVEESVTGMEREERQKTPNLVNGKEVTITIK